VPEPTLLLVVRHGQTAYNSSQRIQGQLDIGLDDTGHAQAQKVASALRGQDIAAVHSSDLSRAVQTAQPLARALGLALHAHADLRERHFGRFQGLSYSEIEAQFPDDARRWRTREPDFQPGGGESLLALSARVQAAFTRLAQAHAGHTVVVVSHGGVLDALYRLANGIGLQGARTWQLANAAIHRVLFNGEGFRVIGWDDQQHLEEPGPASSGAEEVSA
jgi:2,3-bisphosphoglycerate-dependent phosphoglycerate mutase